jgi:hypothetical protein
MSEIELVDKYNVSNAHVYDLQESIKASKYPMLVNIDSATSQITDTVVGLASSNKGEGHDQFLTGIIVSFDLTASNKMWVEAERYRFLYFVSSQSTMHRIAKFNIASQSIENVDTEILNRLEEIKDEYIKNPTPENYLRLLYNIPSGFMLTARLTTNYRELKTIYCQRKNHRLPEWRTFCKWIEELPSFKYLCLGE